MSLLAIAFCACNETKNSSSSNEEKSDSIEMLTRENEQLRNETDDLLSTLNEIEEGFREINEAQGRLTIDRRGEGANARERIREDMQYIQVTMAQNAELIEKLRSRLRESGKMSEQLQRTIDNFTAQLEQKATEIQQLRDELNQGHVVIISSGAGSAWQRADGTVAAPGSFPDGHWIVFYYYGTYCDH